MTKNKKLMKLIGAPAAVLAVSTALGTCLSLASCSERIVGDYIVQFDAGNGKFTSNIKTKIGVNRKQTLDQIIQPSVESNVSSEMFAGWTDESGQEVPGQFMFSSNVTLKAKYANSVSGEYVTVKFTAGSTGATLHGNTTVAVKNGHRFFMVNRPTATKDKQIFKGWALSTAPTTVIDVDYQFISNVELVPVFKDELTFTFHGNDTGVTLVRGTESFGVETGTTFADVNAPSYSCGTKIFTGWYKEASCETKWSDAEQVVAGSVDAYAKWEDAPTSLFCTMNYEQGDCTIVPTFSSTTQLAKRTYKWKEVNQPTVTTTSGDYKVTGWKYTENGPTVSPRGWTEVTDQEMLLNYPTLYICPILSYSGSGVNVYGETSILPEQSITYSAVVTGATTQTVTWKVYSDSTCETEATDASITSAGVLTTGNITSAKSLYVQATSTVVSTVKSPAFAVSVVMPYTGSDKVWYNNGTHWYSISQDEACTSSSTITQTQINTSTTSTITKATAFTNTLYFGDYIYVTPVNMFQDWTGFNGNITFNNVGYIYPNFLIGCTSFNKSLSGLNTNKIEWIGDGFLSGCTAYNQAIDLSNATSLEGLGNEFLFGCTAFNSALTLPDTTTFTSIGLSFLAGCTAFAQNLTLPEHITEILGFFMTDCRNYTGTLTVNCPVSAFAGQADQDFSSLVNTGAIYTTGYNLAGTNAQAFWNKFIDMSSTTCYRRRVSQSYNTTLTASEITVTGSTDTYTFSIGSGAVTSRDSSYSLTLTPTHTGSEITSGTIYVKVTAIADASGQTFSASLAGQSETSTLGSFAYDATTAQTFTVYLKDTDGNAVTPRGDITITLSLTTTA